MSGQGLEDSDVNYSYTRTNVYCLGQGLEGIDVKYSPGTNMQLQVLLALLFF